jgi:hypothetical protein
MRKTLLCALALLAGCSTQTPAPGSLLPDTSKSSTADLSGPTALTRFVVVATPDTKPVDIVNIDDPAKKYATGLKPGAVTDFMQVPVRLALMDSTGKLLEGSMSGPDLKAPRNTIVVGTGSSGPQSTGFREKDGKVDLSQSGLTMPAGKAILIGSGLGFGKGSGLDKASLTLGGGKGKCVPSAGSSSQIKDHDTVGGGSIPVQFAAEPGALDLTWYGDPSCTAAQTASAKATVEADNYAYVVPYLSDPTHFRFLIVPVTANGGGKSGVVDAPAGPAYTDASKATTETSTPDASETPDPSDSGQPSETPEN